MKSLYNSLRRNFKLTLKYLVIISLSGTIHCNALANDSFFDFFGLSLLPPKRATISAVGDLMVHKWQLSNAYLTESNTYSFDSCFQSIKEHLSTADLTIGNLETVFAGKEIGYSDYPCFNTPDEFGQALKNAGFDLLTTANNHCNDKGEKGLLRTIEVLDRVGLEHIGTYKTAEERDKIYIKDINGMKFAILAYTYGTNGIPLTNGKPYLANVLTKELVQKDIAEAKKLEPDFIIILPHMGNEYQEFPEDEFRGLVKFMFESGADIVLASHPHVLQPFELFTIQDKDGTQRECFAAYSLGNFISSQRTQPREVGIILNLNFEKAFGKKAELKNLSYVPTWVKFIKETGGYDIKVLNIREVIEKLERGEKVGLRQKDILRLKAVNKGFDEKLLKINNWKKLLEDS